MASWGGMGAGWREVMSELCLLGLVWFCFVFGRRSFCVAQGEVDLSVLLPHCPKCWGDYKCTAPWLEMNFPLRQNPGNLIIPLKLSEDTTSTWENQRFNR